MSKSSHLDREPYVLAMILADAVHQDPGTGKFTILGTFHAIHAGEFPTPVQFAVYFAVTDWLAGEGHITSTVGGRTVASRRRGK